MRASWWAWGLGLAVSLWSMACGKAAPELEPIAAQTIAVSETLRIPLTVKNPDGASLSFSVEVQGGKPAGFDRVASVASSPTGGEFQWTPLASHVGTHELTFTVSSSGGSSSQSVAVTVTPAQDTAPVFMRPGAGATFDLTRDPCVVFDVEVRDDDSASVTIAARNELPEGSLLDTTGDKSAHFDWCPTPDQVDKSARWTISLSADDGDHPATPHDFIVVLRSAPHNDCPGDAPSIEVFSPTAGSRVAYDRGYVVSAEVTDDMALRDAPLLYYSLSEPEDLEKPDLQEFSQVLFARQGAAWLARVPSLGLAEGEEREVFVVISATDNDDMMGARCDHVSETDVFSFTAIGGTGGELAQNGAACAASNECESGACVVRPGGSKCFASCASGEACESGECQAATLSEGRATSACIPGACVDDSFEQDDTRETAHVYTSNFHAMQCEDDNDYVRINGSNGTKVIVTISGWDASETDMDLAMLASSGRMIGSSAGVTAMEEVEACIDTTGYVIAHPELYSGAPATAYDMQVTMMSGSCCTADTYEPNDSLTNATTLSFTSDVASISARLCPLDDDMFAFTLTADQHVNLSLTFSSSADLNMQIYDADGFVVATSTDGSGHETIETDLIAGRFVVRVTGYEENAVDYMLTVTRSTASAPSCSVTKDCATPSVCRGGTCQSASCTSDASCPAMHICPIEALDSTRDCAAACAVNSDCRSDESCKWFYDGRGCARRGSGANGAPCTTHTDCGGQRACVPWNRGYCARSGCTRNADCESTTFCSNDVCVVDCSTEPSLCRTADGYTCKSVTDAAGASRYACVPSGA